MDGGGRIVVVTAVRAETRAVLGALAQSRRDEGTRGCRRWHGRAGTRNVAVIECGIGPDRAAAALRAVIDPNDLVLSIGFAGALVAGAAPSDILVPETIVWDRGKDLERYPVSPAARDAAIHQLPMSGTHVMTTGPLFSSPTVLATPAAKRAVAARTGAVAVEMETAGLVAVAREHGVPLLAVRAILDDVDASLAHIPPDLESSWTARAKLLGRPAAWPGVLALARHVPGAARALSRAAAAVLPVLAR